MKVDEEVRKELVANLKGYVERLAESLNEYIEKIKKAETVEEIMKIKQNLLLFYLGMTPLTTEHCYFCIAAKGKNGYPNCKKCLYAVHHGECGYQNSDWSKIMRRILEVMDFIRDFYYKGERYDHVE